MDDHVRYTLVMTLAGGMIALATFAAIVVMTLTGCNAENRPEAPCVEQDEGFDLLGPLNLASPLHPLNPIYHQ